MLNDFAFAVQEGEKVPYAGTILFAADAVLRELCNLGSMASITASCKHDLESAVKVVAAWLLPGVRSKLRLVCHTDAHAVLAMWDAMAKDSDFLRLQPLLETARKGEYDGVCHLIEAYFING